MRQPSGFDISSTTGVGSHQRLRAIKSWCDRICCPDFGDIPIESIKSQAIEDWLSSMTQASSTRRQALVLMHGIFRRARKVWGLQSNPVTEVEKPPIERSADLQVYSPEEVWALVRAGREF